MLRSLPVVVAALAIAPGLPAQSAADARWLADCRDREDGWRVKHCEVRVSSLKATGDAVTVDPGGTRTRSKCTPAFRPKLDATTSRPSWRAASAC